MVRKVWVVKPGIIVEVLVHLCGVDAFEQGVPRVLEILEPDEVVENLLLHNKLIKIKK